MKYLNLLGLKTLVENIKTWTTGQFVKIQPGKGLSSNDYTSEEKEKLSGLENYSHPTTPGNKHIPSGGSSGQVLTWSSNGTAVWKAAAGGGFSVSSSAPADKSLLWIDTSVGGVLKYHNGTSWVPTKSVWG